MIQCSTVQYDIIYSVITIWYDIIYTQYWTWTVAALAPGHTIWVNSVSLWNRGRCLGIAWRAGREHARTAWRTVEAINGRAEKFWIYSYVFSWWDTYSNHRTIWRWNDVKWGCIFLSRKWENMRIYLLRMSFCVSKDKDNIWYDIAWYNINVLIWYNIT